MATASASGAAMRIASGAARTRGREGFGRLLRRAMGLLAVLVLAAGCSTTAETLQPIAPPPGPPTKYAAMVIDASNGAIVHQENANDPRYPASLTKMMTLFMLFEAMEEGRVSKTTQIPFSAHAARQPPSKLGFRPGETIDVNSAILALSVKSGNDVAAAVGEHLGGTEEAFAAQMTARARRLGMTATTFRNASGLPDPGQQTTARDMALLGLALRRNFPQHYHYFSNRQFTFRGKVIRGHNDLIGRVEGVDGIKTGYIRASGFNIVTSVSRGGKRLIIVVMGGDTGRARNARVEELIERYLPGPKPASSLLSSMSSVE